MKRVLFNHAPSRLPGPITLIFGLLLVIILGALISLYHTIDRGNSVLIRQLEARQEAMAFETGSASKKKLAVSHSDSAEIIQAQLQIQTPWISLLSALEKAQQPNIYWMHLAPDVKRKHVRMSILAPKRQQGWALMEHLKQQSELSDVKLNASESTEVNGQRMTTLQLEAGWKY